MAPRQRLQVVGVWGATLLAAGLFLLGAVAKLAGADEAAAAFERLGYGPLLLPVVGVAEAIGVALFVVPRTTPVGAVLLGTIALGAAGSHVRAGEQAEGVVPALLLLVVGAVGYARWRGRRALAARGRVRAASPIAARGARPAHGGALEA